MDTKQRNIHEINKDRIIRNTNSRARQKKIATQRIRAGFSILILFAVVIFIIMMTPIFNIKTIGVSGNKIVSLSRIEACVGELSGQNLFRVSHAEVAKRLDDIPYIENIEISKKPFPSTLYIKIFEAAPAAYLTLEGKQLVLDSEMKVIDDSSAVPIGSIPEVMGVTDVKYSVGKMLDIPNSEKSSALKAFLSSAASAGILNSVNSIDIGNTLSITFRYDNRLDVICGSSLELSRKIRMFKEVISNASMKADADGTLDLSEPGKAIHSPSSEKPNSAPNTNNTDDKNDDELDTDKPKKGV